MMSALSHECIRTNPFLIGRDAEYVDFLMTEMDLQVYQPGEHIIQEGEKLSWMTMIHRGKVEMFYGSSRRSVGILGDGDGFGQAILLGPAERSLVTVVAVEFCDCRVIHRDTLMRAGKRFPLEGTLTEIQARHCSKEAKQFAKLMHDKDEEEAARSSTKASLGTVIMKLHVMRMINEKRRQSCPDIGAMTTESVETRRSSACCVGDSVYQPDSELAPARIFSCPELPMEKLNLVPQLPADTPGKLAISSSGFTASSPSTRFVSEASSDSTTCGIGDSDTSETESVPPFTSQCMLSLATRHNMRLPELRRVSEFRRQSGADPQLSASMSARPSPPTNLRPSLRPLPEKVRIMRSLVEKNRMKRFETI